MHDKIGPRKLAINKPMSGVRDLLEHLKWMRDVLKNRETETSYIYICMNCASMNLQVTAASYFFFLQSQFLVRETVSPGQINWRAFAHRPDRLMKRPRGYLQGHTKELVEMLYGNWALSRVPWVASIHCRPCFQGTVT